MVELRRSRRVKPAGADTTNAARVTRKRGVRSGASSLHATTTTPSQTQSTTRRKAKKSSPSYLQRSQSEADADPNRKLRIFSLPREIFDEIASHLPPDGLACFTLSCKEALISLGTSSWEQFRGRARYYRPQGSLVELLQRDIPGSEYCPRCETIHPPTKPPHAHRSTKLTKLCLGQGGVIDYWPQTASGGYSLVFEHIEQAFTNKPTDSATSPPIELFNSDFTHQGDPLSYSLRSEARWIDRNLVLIHEHRLRTTSTLSGLQAGDVTSLPMRLCPHLTTSTTDMPSNSLTRRTRKISPNGPLLTHAITSAFPENRRRGVTRGSSFRAASSSEQAQMDAADAGEDVLWRCRSCPTKFRVRFESTDGGELVVTTWHCFGRELYRALELWRLFVRREGPNLGPKKRNSEFYSPGKSVPEFKIE